MESWYGAKADTKKKYNNQSLEPIAASWAAPAQLLVGVKQKASNMNTKTDEKDTRTTPLLSIQRKRPMVSGAKVGLVVLCLWLAFFGFVIFALNSPFRSLEAMIMDIPDVIGKLLFFGGALLIGIAGLVTGIQKRRLGIGILAFVLTPIGFLFALCAKNKSPLKSAGIAVMPNGGPAEPLDNSSATSEPPSTENSRQMTKLPDHIEGTLRSSRSWEERRDAAWQLGELGDPESVAALVGALKDTTKHVSVAAAQALGKIGHPNAVAPLLGALAEDRRHKVSGAASRALQAIVAQGLTPIIDALKHPQTKGKPKCRHT